VEEDEEILALDEPECESESEEEEYSVSQAGTHLDSLMIKD